ncbi:hypothetical protein HUJ04_000536 [Dendroctonus ponderosae]|nr:hypothetical protein HUJ04_000536 [Dendroctonus ponderosae]
MKLLMMPYMLTDLHIRKFIGFSLASAGDREGGRKSRPMGAARTSLKAGSVWRGGTVAPKTSFYDHEMMNKTVALLLFNHIMIGKT